MLLLEPNFMVPGVNDGLFLLVAVLLFLVNILCPVSYTHLRFLRACAERYGVPFGNTYIDTLPLAQALYRGPVSYTHLDVYKRQGRCSGTQRIENRGQFDHGCFRGVSGYK